QRDSSSTRFVVNAIRRQRDSSSTRFVVNALRRQRDSSSTRFVVNAIRRQRDSSSTRAALPNRRGRFATNHADPTRPSLLFVSRDELTQKI
ncbi:MAG: hypothetical protein ACM3ZE_15615, partial [Myxococcales bacterium]